MRTQPVEFLEWVEVDIRKACAFYDSWQFEGAQKFQTKFLETIAWIEWNPELFPRIYKHFRRAIVRRTYFGVFYAIEPTVTIVVALLDLRRNPKTIRRMLSARGEGR